MKPIRWHYLIIGIVFLVAGILSFLFVKNISFVSLLTLGLVSFFNAYMPPKVFSNDKMMQAIRHKCGFISFFASIFYMLILYTLVQFGILINVILGMIVVINLAIITMFVCLLIYSKKEE